MLLLLYMLLFSYWSGTEFEALEILIWKRMEQLEPQLKAMKENKLDTTSTRAQKLKLGQA